MWSKDSVVIGYSVSELSSQKAVVLDQKIEGCEAQQTSRSTCSFGGRVVRGQCTGCRRDHGCQIQLGVDGFSNSRAKLDRQRCGLGGTHINNPSNFAAQPWHCKQGLRHAQQVIATWVKDSWYVMSPPRRRSYFKSMVAPL